MSNTNFKYELFFELSPDLLCIAGYDGYFKKINTAVSTLLGYSIEELYAAPINDFVFEDDKVITAKVRKELTRSKTLFNFENRYVTKKGEIVWLSWTALPVDKDQVIFAIAKNITHIKGQETKRNAMLTNLTRVNNDLKQLTYTTSHDLRSPVNNLLSILSLIDITKISDLETKELLEILILTGGKLQQTLNDYVDVLSETHTVNANIEEVDLSESLTCVLNSINSLIKTSKTSITTDFSKLAKIKFKKTYMESVFLNLITNSIKYASPDRLPELAIYSESVDGMNKLIITDNGLGFDMEKVKDRIFGLHQKFHDRNDSKGIGLYLVYNHITSLRGQISVESKVNEGTKFEISFVD